MAARAPILGRSRRRKEADDQTVGQESFPLVTSAHTRPLLLNFIAPGPVAVIEIGRVAWLVNGSLAAVIRFIPPD